MDMESRKKARMEAGDGSSRQALEHPTLRLYYRQISTLRSYLISKLPLSAKSRRRKVETAGIVKPQPEDQGRIAGGGSSGPASGAPHLPDELDRHSQTRLAALLDDTLVCTPEGSQVGRKESRDRDWMDFSQQANISVGSTLDEGTTSTSDVSTRTDLVRESEVSHDFVE
jgi:hypothetical protein